MTGALARVAGIDWKRNALRKSYASYRLAETGNAYTTAEETGHSVVICKKIYREIVTKDQADEWFELMPPNGYGGNIVPIRSGVAAVSG